MTLDYNDPLHHPRGQRGMSWRSIVGWCAGGLLLFALVVALLMPSMGRARETANRSKCASCLRQIGQAASIYANEHAGMLPPDLISLYQHTDITQEVFTCSSSAIAKADGPTRAQIVTSMLSGNHLSYAWTGGGLTSTAPLDVIIAFDLELHVPRDNATTTGMNVLFADGHVTFVDETAAKAVWAQFVAGVRPIRLPMTAPATPAATSKSSQ
jgi:prepilin-type processing-associated H-X9-DG protein